MGRLPLAESSPLEAVIIWPLAMSRPNSQLTLAEASLGYVLAKLRQDICNLEKASMRAGGIWPWESCD